MLFRMWRRKNNRLWQLWQMVSPKVWKAHRRHLSCLVLSFFTEMVCILPIVIFLSKIRSALGYRIPVEKLVFGTDEALALVNAIKTNFPSSQHILCTRHLKANAQRKFLNHNVLEEIRNRIISAIFDKTGLIYSNSHISYFERESKVWKISGMLGANISKINCSIH